MPPKVLCWGRVPEASATQMASWIDRSFRLEAGLSGRTRTGALDSFSGTPFPVSLDVRSKGTSFFRYSCPPFREVSHPVIRREGFSSSRELLSRGLSPLALLAHVPAPFRCQPLGHLPPSCRGKQSLGFTRNRPPASCMTVHQWCTFMRIQAMYSHKGSLRWAFFFPQMWKRDSWVTRHGDRLPPGCFSPCPYRRSANTNCSPQP